MTGPAKPKVCTPEGERVVRTNTRTKPRKGYRERLRHLVWAGLIALILQFSTLLVPLDQLFNLAQYRQGGFQASGQIAFIGTQNDLTDPANPRRREDLARFISDLDRAGAKEIYVDLVFDRASAAGSDAALREALLATRGRAVLVDKGRTTLDGTAEVMTSIPAISSGVDQVGSVIWTDYIYGIVWIAYPMRFFLEEEPDANTTSTSQIHGDLAARLAGTSDTIEKPFWISYFFDLETIPIYRLERLLDQPGNLRQLAGKKVIIGAIASTDAIKANVPGQLGVPPSIVDIFAAETLMSGHTGGFDGMEILVVALVLMIAAALVPNRRWRYGVYATVALSLPLAYFVATQFAIRMNGASVLILLLAYCAFRARSTWKSSFTLIDADTDLPTFIAFEGNKDIAEAVPTIIVAKVHRFEEVRRTLPPELQSEYILRIIARLKAATQDATLYIGQGNLIAWTMEEKEPTLLRDHLEGLRALFASPLMVGDNAIDVSVTFGVDVTASPNVARRLASAIAAAEKTNETFEPIAIADAASDEDLIWNISLQARIDAALASGEIYLVFQPKVDVATGALIGVEALVRWNDPARGHIAPDQFIRQCENAGRMSHLTRHVLTHGCLAGQELQRACGPVPVAVNISATLLHERSIVRMVREVLSATGYDPRLLVLEITETYRIADLDRAGAILAELKALGTKISMDDFGVGAASLEALMHLPFSELKIDRLFISRMGSDPKAMGIVTNVLHLGKDLGITVVAEGVEDQKTLQMLRDSQCPVAQGYGIARPSSLEDVIIFQGLASQSAA
ncbi:EAL domain-containing protein [Aurantiacibacter xanthus]|uniref:EAL domain-containing protein n=1 Tax=Aurantiacibacter xanthus TaxID=1784712 RepID=A0A3A1PIN5_9SPHN|nr:EAL domain-containing protein [Aurantiacibacter xanthus]RIV92841.1 EAL domain-containing protein [Aurantiacibacter xanthus]